MLATQADLRHIVLFTDGQSRPGDYDPLLGRLRAKKIGLSTIGLGPEADTQLLSSLAKLGEGRYYFTERTPELPRIMTREIAISKRSAQVEGQIQPQLVSSSPILRGIGHRADVTLERARDGRFADLERPAAAVVDPAGRSATAPLRQVAPGRYSASVIGDVPGTYQLTVTGQPDSAGATRSETSGFVIQA